MDNGKETDVQVSEEDILYMMEKFKLSRENAIAAIRKGFRVEALRNGTAMDMFIRDSGIAAKVDTAKRKINELNEESRG